MKIENYKSNVKKQFYNAGLDDLVAATSGSVNISKNNVLKEDATVLACVDLIASTIASMGLVLYEKTENGREKVQDNLAFLVKNRPNPKVNAFNFFRDIIKNMLVYGDGFALIKTKAGQVTSLEVLDGESTKLDKFNGVYTVSSIVDDKQVTLNYNQVIHISDIENRFEAIKGIVEAKKYCNNLISNYFKAGKAPAKGVINTTASLSNEAKIGLKRAFNAVLSSENDGVAVLDDGNTYTAIGSNKSFQEQQINDLCISLDNEIFKVFRVPKSLVGNNSEASSYNSLQALQESFVKGLQCFLKQIEEEFNFKCLPTEERNNKYFSFNSRSAMRLTDTERADYYKKMFDMGVLSINNILEMEDMNTIDGGDSHYTTLNSVDIKIADKYQLNKAGADDSEVDSMIE